MVTDKKMLKKLQDMEFDFREASGRSSFFDPETKKEMLKRAETLDWAIKKLKKVVE